MSVADAPGALFAPGLAVFPHAGGEDHTESAYPLVPMQAGMLFNSLLDPGAGVEIEQLVFRLPESVDADALAAAWREVTQRHDILRTSFRWEGVQVPSQVVDAQVELEFAFEDLGELSEDGAEARLREWLRADRMRGFELARAPLQRVALFRRGDADWTLVWTFHHALLDGRAMVLVLSDVFNAYEARRDGVEVELPALRPFRDYVEWHAAHDFGASEAFWRELLDGVTPTPVPGVQPGYEAGELVQQSARLAREHTAALEALAANRKLTLNTLVQAAWGVLLARHAGTGDVVFGTTRACRRSAAGGAETIVGPVFNSVPLRLRIGAGQSLLACAETLREQSLAVRPYENTPLQRIQEWCGVHGTPLLETLVVYENRTMTNTLQKLGGGWANRSVQILRKSNFPLSLSRTASRSCW
jgi:hypothetical protein